MNNKTYELIGGGTRYNCRASRVRKRGAGIYENRYTGLDGI